VFYPHRDHFDQVARRGPPRDMLVASTQPASSRRSPATGCGRDRRRPSDTSPAVVFDVVRHGVRPDCRPSTAAYRSSCCSARPAVPAAPPGRSTRRWPAAIGPALPPE
jgi:hypothetical protein